MTGEVWRPFAWRAFIIWVAIHALAAVAVALVAVGTGVEPAGHGLQQGLWMLAMTATLLGVDIARNRERLLLHDLGVRLRVLIPLVMLPAVVAESLFITVT